MALLFIAISALALWIVSFRALSRIRRETPDVDNDVSPTAKGGRQLDYRR